MGLIKAGRAHEAEALLRRLLARGRKNPAAYSLLATAAAAQQRPADAEGHARAALALQPAHAPYHLQLAALLDTAGQSATACDSLQQAVALAPGDATARHRLAALCRRLGRDDDALDQIDAALALRPDTPEMLALRGDLLRDLGRTGEAVAAYRRVEALQPGQPAAALRLASLLLAAGDLDGAEAAYVAAMRRGADHAGLYKRLGDIHLRRGTHDRAEAAYRGAIARSPGDPVLHLALAAVLDARGKPEAALQARSRAQAVTPHRLLPLSRFADRSAEPPGAPAGPRRNALALDDAVVVNGEWHVIHRGRLYPDLAVMPARDHGPGVQPVEGLDYALVSAAWPMRFETAPVLLLGGGSYAHWLLEALPRLAIAEQDGEFPAMPLLAPPDLRPAQMQGLRRLGIDRARLHVHPRGTLIRCRRLVVPLITGRPFAGQGMPDRTVPDCAPAAIVWLRRRILGAEPPPGWRKLFLLPGTQAPEDGEAAAKVAAAHGFEAVDPARLAFDDQVALFAEAARIAGPRVPAFANLVFAPRGTIVTELAAGDAATGFVPGLAAALGHAYRRLDAPTRNGRLVLDEESVAAALA